MTVVSREKRGLIIELNLSKNLVRIVSMLIVLEELDDGSLPEAPIASAYECEFVNWLVVEVLCVKLVDWKIGFFGCRTIGFLLLNVWY